MKSILLGMCLITCALFAPSAAISSDRPLVSQEQILVEKAKTRALVSDKPVLVLATGVWCPPCFELHEAMAKKPEEFKTLLSRFEFVTLEETWTKRLPYDYLGVTMIGYPSFYLWDPRTDRWNSFGAWQGAEVILRDLNAFAEERERFADARWSRFVSEVEAGKHFGEDDVNYEFSALTIFFAGAYPIDDVIAKFHAIEKFRTERPEQFSYATDEEFYAGGFTSAFQVLLGRKGVSLATIQAEFPLALPNEALRSDLFNVRRFLYEIPLISVMRESGWAVAAEKCDGIAETALAEAGSLSANDQTALRLRTKFNCADLKFSTGKWTSAEYRAFLDALALTEKQKSDFAAALWNAYADLGDVEKTLEYVQKHYDYYLKDTADAPGILARVKEGFDALIASQSAGRRNPNDTE